MKYFQITPIIFIMLLLVSNLFASDPISIDGLFDDWNDVSNIFSDVNGDGFDEDFSELRITNDNRFLFLRFAFYNSEHLLQDFNSIKLFIDTDNNPATGLSFHGIGAELEWCFGCREGIYYTPNSQVTLLQNDLTLRSAPTITSRQFEVALALQSDVMTLNNSQTADSISVVLMTSDGADLLPDQFGGAIYVIDSEVVEPPAPIPLSRDQEDHVRVLTYNVNRSNGGLLDPSRQQHFQRILQALDADIMAFQEQDNAEQVRALLSAWLQQTELRSVVLGNNNMVVSKYPILNQAVLTNSGRTMAVLLDTKAQLGTDVLIINSHLSCCRNDFSRQQDADELIMVLREWLSGNGPFAISANIPIIHLGDFNLVGFSNQLETLAEGNITDEFRFGPDFPPDWDGTPLTDLFSRHISIRMGYTWRNDFSEFSPGKLDYILYTDSVIELGNHFVLNTLAMSESELATYSLQSEDTNLASDHLPRIMDIAAVLPVSVEEVAHQPPRQFILYPAYPNPFNPMTTIQYDLSRKSNVRLVVYDILGREVSILVDEAQPAGTYKHLFSADGLASGIYLIRFEAGQFYQTEWLVLLK